MSTFAIAGYLLFEAIGLVNFFMTFRNIPEGWEDEAGFHLGRPASREAVRCD